MTKSPNLELRKEWEKRITDCKASGQTQVKWCESNDISIHQFRYWMKGLKRIIMQRKQTTLGFH